MPTIKVNDISLFYELHGQETAPLLVLNNGILMNTASWVYQKDALARRYRLLLYDCRGQGQSQHSAAAYSMEQHAADLAGLLDALELPAAHIAGISYGGEVAQAFALAYPARTQSLILADTVSEVGPELALCIQSWLAAARLADADLFFETTTPWNFSLEFIAANPELFAQSRRRYRELDYPAVVRLCEAFLQVDFTGRLSEIQAPTCILVGGEDKLKGLNYARILQRGIPHAELHILPGAGHASCWEKPEEFNTIVLGFLAKQPD
ncbi:MAG: alpha/beta fold hydrolase [Anaerolineales bacterium]